MMRDYGLCQVRFTRETDGAFTAYVVDDLGVAMLSTVYPYDPGDGWREAYRALDSSVRFFGGRLKRAERKEG